MSQFDTSETTDKAISLTPPSLGGNAFVRAFPFYLELDRNLRVLSVGPSLLKACPAVETGSAFSDFFQVTRPLNLQTSKEWHAHAGQLILLKGLGSTPLTLRGSAESGEDGSLLLLMAPVIQTRDEEQQLGLERNDFAKHDNSGTALLLTDTTRMAAKDAERMSERLIERTEQMTTILALSDNGTAYFGADSMLRHTNSALRKMLDIGEAEAFDLDIDAFGSRVNALLRQSDDGVSHPPSRLIASTQDEVAGIRIELAKPRVAVIHVKSARTKDGGWVFYFRDITHEDAVDRMKSEFLAAAAHELRTPMVSVMGFIELLIERNFSDERRADMLGIIHRQSKLMVKMINELLDLARIESERGLEFQMAAHPLNVILDNTVKGLMRRDTDSQVIVGEVPHVLVRVDPEKIQQAVSNLLSNAFKYSPSGGEVNLTATLDVHETREFAVIKIMDRGIGMTPSQLARAFERFYRVDASGKVPGTGLGLSIVKELVDLHHGRIELQSEEGQGTTARLWLPLAPQ
jgi:signal transduction histidine kinase